MDTRKKEVWELVYVCAWCQEDIVEDGTPKTILVDKKDQAGVSHGMCKSCFDIKVAELRSGKNA